MPQARWRATAGARYWIDVRLGTRDALVMIDLGLIDPKGLVGFELEPGLYDALKQTGQLSHVTPRSRRDASGRITRSESALLTAQLIHERTRTRIGPAVDLYVSRGSPGVPNRVGVVFFHHLRGCRVLWDLDQRTWSIEYP